jgi:hypothetical protein
MGCFDVVCALTNVPIRSNEKCHLVIFKKDVDWDYGVVWAASSETHFGASNTTVFHGEYNDYGSIDNTGTLTDKQKKVLAEFDEDRDILHFFVCDMAWQWAQEKFKKWTPMFIKDRQEMREHMASSIADVKKKGKAAQTKHDKILLKITEGDKERDAEDIALARVMQGFVQACKHPLSGLGCYHQYGAKDTEEGIREVMALTEARLKERENWYKEQFGEDEEDEDQDVDLG